MALIRTELSDHVAIIAFDNYAKRNALSYELIAETIAALDALKRDRARVVVLCSAVDEAVWSAGHSVDELPRADIDPLPYDEPLEQLLRAIKAFPAPVIAMVHGSVWGGACDLVMACDIVYGDETSSFAITPAKIGLPYNSVGILNFMSRLPLNVVKEMFFTADPIGAERAERVGNREQADICGRAQGERHGPGEEDRIALTRLKRGFQGGDPGFEQFRGDQPGYPRISSGTSAQGLFRRRLPRRHIGLSRKAPGEILKPRHLAGVQD